MGRGGEMSARGWGGAFLQGRGGGAEEGGQRCALSVVCPMRQPGLHRGWHCQHGPKKTERRGQGESRNGGSVAGLAGLERVCWREGGTEGRKARRVGRQAGKQAGGLRRVLRGAPQAPWAMQAAATPSFSSPPARPPHLPTQAASLPPRAPSPPPGPRTGLTQRRAATASTWRRCLQAGRRAGRGLAGQAEAASQLRRSGAAGGVGRPGGRPRLGRSPGTRRPGGRERSPVGCSRRGRPFGLHRRPPPLTTSALH